MHFLKSRKLCQFLSYRRRLCQCLLCSLFNKQQLNYNHVHPISNILRGKNSLDRKTYLHIRTYTRISGLCNLIDRRRCKTLVFSHSCLEEFYNLTPRSELLLEFFFLEMRKMKFLGIKSYLLALKKKTISEYIKTLCNFTTFLCN